MSKISQEEYEGESEETEVKKDIEWLKNHVDESETTIKSLLDGVTTHSTRISLNGSLATLKDFRGYIDQLDEPELPVIPKFVADWLEEAKCSKLTLFGAMNESPREVDYWFIESDSTNQDLFARAWLDGYTVEEEQKYRVSLHDGTWLVSDDNKNISKATTYFMQTTARVDESKETEVKTLESIREEIWEEMLRLEDKRKDQWADIKYQTLREVLQKLGHLDEPEVLSQEWISDKSIDTHVDTVNGEIQVTFILDDLQNLLVPKRGLPVIPKFVADFIKVRKGTDAYSLKYILCVAVERSEQEEYTKAYDWISANDELFARAWLDGYTAEEEQKYYVMNNENELLLSKNNDDEVITYSQYYPQVRKVLSDLSHYQLTEQEIKDYDPRYMAFAQPVEEFEE